MNSVAIHPPLAQGEPHPVDVRRPQAGGWLAFYIANTAQVWMQAIPWSSGDTDRVLCPYPFFPTRDAAIAACTEGLRGAIGMACVFEIRLPR